MFTEFTYLNGTLAAAIIIGFYAPFTKDDNNGGAYLVMVLMSWLLVAFIIGGTLADLVKKLLKIEGKK